MNENSSEKKPAKQIARRVFVNTIATATVGSVLLLLPCSGFSAGFYKPTENMTVQQVIDLILKSVPGAPFPKTVDTIKAGDASQTVTGIVTTMFATVDVIEKAAALKANFIIAHEPSFYNHLDETNWLENDDAYKYKMALLKKYNITVWRFHDAIHAHRPDGVMTGVLTALGWEKNVDPQKQYLINIPATSLQHIIDLSKKKLGISHLRYIGDKKQLCSRIVMAPGSAGGRMQINAISKEKPDLLICGELDEWETSEYVRDLRSSGSKTALIVLGHIVSEEPGLEWLEKWLQPQISGIPVKHIPSTDAFSWA